MNTTFIHMSKIYKPQEQTHHTVCYHTWAHEYVTRHTKMELIVTPK